MRLQLHDSGFTAALGQCRAAVSEYYYSAVSFSHSLLSRLTETG